MNKWLATWHVVVTALLVALVVSWASRHLANDSGTEYPTRPIRVVVPFSAGGGTDTFARVMQKGIAETGSLSQPLVIVNQPGGAGTIGSREVKEAPSDGYTILCLNNAIISAEFAGAADYGPDDFEPLAMTGELPVVIVVREDAPYASLAEMLEQARQAPRTIRFGANLGSPAYYSALQLEASKPGAHFSMVSSDGGANRYSKLIGGHLDAVIFSVSEYIDFRGPEGTPPDQNVRAIALMGPTRNESIPDVPTSVEQGIPVVMRNAHYWWAPQGTPREIVDTLATALHDAMQNQQVRSEFKRLQVGLSFRRDEDFRRWLDDVSNDFESVMVTRQTRVPNFVVGIVIVVAILATWAAAEAWNGRSVDVTSNDEEAESFTHRPAVALACFLILAAYVGVLGAKTIPFAVASTAMIAVIGAVLARHQRTNHVVLLQLALLGGFGGDWLFTQALGVFLP